MWKLILQWLAGKKGTGLQQNPYFSNPGSAPFNDSTFDANAQMPFKGNNFWDRIAGNDYADRANAQHMLSRLSREDELEFKKKTMELERDQALETKRAMAEKLGKAAVPALESTFNMSRIPTGAGGSYEDIAESLEFAYPKIRTQGVEAFSRSDADTAKNLADQLGSINMATKERAIAPYVESTFGANAGRQAAEAKMGYDLISSPEGKRLFNVGEARKLVAPITAGLGSTIFDEATGSIYRGGLPTEKVTVTPRRMGDMELPPQIETIRDYNPGSVSPFGASGSHVGNIKNPVTTPPQAAPVVKDAPGEQSMPARNQDTTIGAPMDRNLTEQEKFLKLLMMDLNRLQQ